ncbi:MAG TPA: Gfo/Idh/MocA family oxidoreductase [Planctomycetota bacterium]|jgi:predicted dehydrogenase
MARHSRRTFLKSAALGAGVCLLGYRTEAGEAPPSEKLNLAVVGIGGRGAGNLGELPAKDVNIVALCDVDDGHAAQSFKRYPNATKFTDYRVMLDKAHKDFDAVLVATPDHTHAVIGAAALKAGKHLYCEKPLTHSVYEARYLTDLAREKKLATQLGTQIHALPNYRRTVEVVWSGAIGDIKEVHVWNPARYAPGDRPTDTPPVPAGLNWDLWLGPAPERPYHPAYVPGKWRGWWDYGTGGMGDFFCHYVDLAYWALKLQYPLSVEAEGSPLHPDSCAQWIIAKYEFPARENLPAVKLTWYDGGKQPTGILPEPVLADWKAGVLFVGEKGMLLGDYNRHKLLPEDKFKDFKAPEATIPNSIGHHAEWVKACKTGSPTTCNFNYSGPLTEAALLGIASYRSGERFQWNAKDLKPVNATKAESYIRREYRKGWTL